MVSFGFFNSSNGDRKYSADDVSRIFSYLITDGVLMTYGDKFFTTPATANLGVVLGTGWAWFNHTWTQSDTAIPFELDEPDPSLDRFDTVYLKVDRRSLGRMNSLGVVKGTAAINPVVPTFPTETDVFYHPLAYVKVRHGVTRIAASDIEILVGKTQAPFITSILQTTDITTLFQGWSEQFGTKMTEWENEIDTLETSLTANVNAVITSANQQLQTQQTQFTTQMSNQQTTFTNSLNGWETDFQTWFDNLQTYLSEDVVTEIWSDLQDLETKNTQQDEAINKVKNSWWEVGSGGDWNAPVFQGALSNGTNFPSNLKVDYPLITQYTTMLGISNPLSPSNDVPKYPTPRMIIRAILSTPAYVYGILMPSSKTIRIRQPGWYEFILVGGGGGGVSSYADSNNVVVGGAGGGAGFIERFMVYLDGSTTSESVVVEIGSGGGVGQNGGDTTVRVGSQLLARGRGGKTGTKPSTAKTLVSYGGDSNLNGANEGMGGGGGGGVYAPNFGGTGYSIRSLGGDGRLGGGGGNGAVWTTPLNGGTASIGMNGGNSIYAGDGGLGSVYQNSTLSYAKSNGANGFGGTGGGAGNGSTSNVGGGGGGGGIGNLNLGGSGGLSNSGTTYAPGGGGGGGIFASGGKGGSSNNLDGYSGAGFGGGGGGKGSGSACGGGGGGGWGVVPNGVVIDQAVSIPSSTKSTTGNQGCVLIMKIF